MSIILVFGGLSYAAVPFYKMVRPEHPSPIHPRVLCLEVTGGCFRSANKSAGVVNPSRLSVTARRTRPDCSRSPHTRDFESRSTVPYRMSCHGSLPHSSGRSMCFLERPPWPFSRPPTRATRISSVSPRTASRQGRWPHTLARSNVSASKVGSPKTRVVNPN